MEVLKKKINKKKNVLMYAYSVIRISLLFSLLWFSFSGIKSRDDSLMLSCGIIAIICTLVFCFVTKIISANTFFLRKSFFKYICALAKGIIISSYQTTKIIFSTKSIINPGIVFFNMSNLTDQEKVLFSNLITMTPGTFVIAIDEKKVLIHAINKEDLNLKKDNKICSILDKMRSNQDDKIKINEIVS